MPRPRPCVPSPTRSPLSGPAEPSRIQILPLILIGALAGFVGGMLGVGGGIVMIPALFVFLGEAAYGVDSLHLYKLASIATSILLAIPATLRHTRANAILYPMQPAILPLATVGVIAGVLLAIQMSGDHTRWLQRLFGATLELVVAVNLYQASWSAHGEPAFRNYCPLPSRRALLGTLVGLPAGFIAGLLGIGGGVWTVPVQRILLGIRLRYAIANSTFTIVVVATVTAIAQTIAVASRPNLRAADGWWLTLWLAPGAMAGGWCGADLTHRLPLRWLRHAFHALLALAGLRLILS